MVDLIPISEIASTRLKPARGPAILGLRRTRNSGIGRDVLRKKFSLAALVGAAVVVATVAAGYTGSARSATAAVTPLPSSSCGPIVYKGSGSPNYIVASDLPLQG